jgi:quercetin dioxygenase-like cupin family protein
MDYVGRYSTVWQKHLARYIIWEHNIFLQESLQDGNREAPMIQKRVYTLSEVDWQSFIRDGVKNISSKSLIGIDAEILNISLTKVEPGGEFGTHRDSYHHVLCFLIGEGEGRIGEETYRIEPGVVAEIPAGHLHGYRNLAERQMFLITVNIKA